LALEEQGWIKVLNERTITRTSKKGSYSHWLVQKERIEKIKEVDENKKYTFVRRFYNNYPIVSAIFLLIIGAIINMLFKPLQNLFDAIMPR
jgi:hypothetical protein